MFVFLVTFFFKKKTYYKCLVIKYSEFSLFLFHFFILYFIIKEQSCCCFFMFKIKIDLLISDFKNPHDVLTSYLFSFCFLRLILNYELRIQKYFKLLLSLGIFKCCILFPSFFIISYLKFNF